MSSSISDVAWARGMCGCQCSASVSVSASASAAVPVSVLVSGAGAGLASRRASKAVSTLMLTTSIAIIARITSAAKVAAVSSRFAAICFGVYSFTVGKGSPAQG